MVFAHSLEDFAGLPVRDFSDSDHEVPEPGAVAWRLRDWNFAQSWETCFEEFLGAVDTAEVTTLVVGHWSNGETYPPDLLAGAADRFPALRNVFVADMTVEENEVSWIQHGDLTGMFRAFPGLERVTVRGNTMRLEPVRSENLRELRFESGGLPGRVVRAVGAGDLPGLEHLELWLGIEEYGGDATVADLEPILSGERLPALRHLGLMNSEDQDEIAQAVAAAPVVARLESLDLSMGLLSDRGVEALLSGQPLTHLRALDLGNSRMSGDLGARLRAALPETALVGLPRPGDAGRAENGCLGCHEAVADCECYCRSCGESREECSCTVFLSDEWYVRVTE
ncbi:STM4015 family protein [Actinomadura kijaniata]|uniref:STM4015 family protein n=1 Tax=Actinomadura kijaniata TaxID=46161 RepID=UPI00082F98B4|nr:STM4015 family protein [Actinomadura kijaniata]